MFNTAGNPPTSQLGPGLQVWVTAEFVKQGYVRSGVRPDRIFVVPHGVRAHTCAAPLDTPPPPSQWKQRHPGKFVFLFHGGALYR